MTRVTNKIVPHRKRSFACMVLVLLKMSFKILMISIYVVCRQVALCGHFTCDSVQHYSVVHMVHLEHKVASLGDLRGRDESSTLNLFNS